MSLLKRMRTGNRGGWASVLGILLLAGRPAAVRAELTQRQQEVLVGILTERYTQRWTDLSTNQLAQLRAKADAYLEGCRKDHLRGGLIASLRYADTNRTEVIRYEALEDGAAQTGFYLTALSFRLAVQRDLKNTSDIRRVLDGIEVLLGVSGRPGYVARFAGRANDPAYKAFYQDFGGPDPSRPGMGRLAHKGGTNHADYVWLGSSDRDQYAALNLGLATAYELVRDPQIRARVTTNVTVILRRLIADDWRLNDGHGNQSFVTPLLATALLRTGATVSPREFQALYETKARHLAEIMRPGELPQPAVQRYHDYRPAAFSMANLVCLARLERSPVRRLGFQDLCSQQWREANCHLNPWFAAGFVSVFDSTTDPISRATLQGVLFQYPDPPRWAGQRETYDPGQLRYVEANGKKWSKIALPLAYQDPMPFQWAHSPFELARPAEAGHVMVVHPGLDLILPFWMGRESGVIPAEDDDPSLATRARRMVRPGAAGVGGSLSSTNRILPPDQRTLSR